jgi:thiamine-phosphate pyrophosphorylase
VLLAFAYYITARRQLGPPHVSSEVNLEDALSRKIQAAFAAGVDYVQLREKDMSGKSLGDLVSDLQNMPEKTNSRRPLRLLVNERLDVAVSCGADGVHLPADSLPLPAVRSRLGSAAVLGVSCHSEDDVVQAGREGANYVLVGPVFPTPSKPEASPLGVQLLRQICRRSFAPVFALGGITRDNAESCVRAGAVGIAGIRLFQQAPDLLELARYLHAL